MDHWAVPSSRRRLRRVWCVVCVCGGGAGGVVTAWRWIDATHARNPPFRGAPLAAAAAAASWSHAPAAAALCSRHGLARTT